MLYVESRKSLRGRTEKNYLFTECQTKTLGKLSSLPSVRKITLSKAQFAECRKKTLSKQASCRVFFFCLVFFVQHSAKRLFAECPTNNTRQTP